LTLKYDYQSPERKGNFMDYCCKNFVFWSVDTEDYTYVSKDASAYPRSETIFTLIMKNDG